MGDHFQITMEAQEGRIVRNGPVVGRIIEVEDESFTVDYGRAFAGEPITCDVIVESVEGNKFKSTSNKERVSR
jgi:FKBP-type peptidyl-prolyl cis-trans isomerase 2